MGIEDNSLRADLEAAFSEAEKAGEAPTTPSDPPSAELVATPEAPAAPAADLDAESRTIDRPDGRDDKGRFAPKAKDAAPEQKSLAAPPQAPSTAPAATDAAPPSPAQPSPAAADLRAPSSWKPAAREKWAALPPEIQQEVVRVDREIRQTMQETAAVRRFASELQQSIAPHEQTIRASGATPAQAIGALLSAQTVLQNGLPAQKAQLVANLCKNFNVPLQELDSYLAGQIPAQGAQPPLDAEMIARQAEERVFARLNQQRMQTASARATQERDSFAAKHEFFDDLREDMADIIETKAKRGVDLSLEDAYNLAVKLHPEISDVLRQREAAKQVATVSAATQRAKTAASSVRTQPISGMKVSNGTGSIRETLEAVYEEVNGR